MLVSPQALRKVGARPVYVNNQSDVRSQSGKSNAFDTARNCVLAHFNMNQIPGLLKCRAVALLIIFSMTLLTFTVNGQTEEAGDRTLKNWIEQGRKLRRDYVIESAVMNVKLDPVVSTNIPRVVDVQVTYTIFALNLTTNFDEEYNSVPGANAEVMRIPGSHPESAYTENAYGRKAWNVLIHVAPGERETIVTEAKYFYKSGVAQTRTIRDFTNLRSNEDVYCYPNTEDVIGELILRIESPIPIHPPRDGDALLVTKSGASSDSVQRSTPSLFAADKNFSSSSVIVAKWKNLTPGMAVELKLAR
jgi:hypothetical protein